MIEKSDIYIFIVQILYYFFPLYKKSFDFNQAEVVFGRGTREEAQNKFMLQHCLYAPNSVAMTFAVAAIAKFKIMDVGEGNQN
jgi:hypothetical protein